MFLLSQKETKANKTQRHYIFFLRCFFFIFVIYFCVLLSFYLFLIFFGFNDGNDCLFFAFKKQKTCQNKQTNKQKKSMGIRFLIAKKGFLYGFIFFLFFYKNQKQGHLILRSLIYGILFIFLSLSLLRFPFFFNKKKNEKNVVNLCFLKEYLLL